MKKRLHFTWYQSMILGSLFFFLLGRGQVFCSASMVDSTETILDNLTSKMTEVLSRVQTSSAPITDFLMVPLNIKLDGSNYGLWSHVVEMYILGKDKLGYINGDYP